jgi:hypothetical protein
VSCDIDENNVDVNKAEAEHRSEAEAELGASDSMHCAATTAQAWGGRDKRRMLQRDSEWSSRKVAAG